MPFDLYHNAKVAIAIPPRTGAVSTAITGSAVDMQDAENALWIFQATGTPTADDTNYLTVTIEESTSGTGDWTALNSTDEGKRRLHTPGEGTNYTAVLQKASLTPATIGSRRGTARYQRAVLVETGTVVIDLSAVAILDHNRSVPVSGT